MNTKHIGDISEAVVAAELLRQGYSVSKPLGDNQRYDLIVDSNGHLYRIQVKTAVIRSNGSVSFPTASTYAHRGGKRKSYLTEVEYIIAYSPDLNRVFWERVDEDTPSAERTLVISGRGIPMNDRTIDKLPLHSGEVTAG